MGARLKFWRRSRVPKKGSRDEAVFLAVFLARDGSAVKSHSTILRRLRRQISLDYYPIPPATQATVSRSLLTQKSIRLVQSFDGNRLEWVFYWTVKRAISRGYCCFRSILGFHSREKAEIKMEIF